MLSKLPEVASEERVSGLCEALWISVSKIEMLSRAKRQDLIVASATLDVGPGAYETSLQRPQQKFAMAPFGATTVRDTIPLNFETPGPGSYLTVNTESRAEKRPSSMFVSKALRIEAEKERIKGYESPGPGAYAPDTHRLASKPKPARQRSMHAAQGINWVQVATAPSIPGHGQSYGYEEGLSGALVQQGPPHKGFTGRGPDMTGPGDYEPSTALTKRNAVACDFGRSASHRNDVVAKDAAQRPGPGSYRPEDVGKGDALHGGIAHQRQLSSFASSTKRSNPSMSAGLAPGPGSYKVVSSFPSLKEQLARQPESFHVFGSTNPHPKPQNDADSCPGPGSYELAGSVSVKDREKASSTFASAAPRFMRDQTSHLAVPGPGMYTVENNLSLNLKKKTVGRFGGFGSTSTRFTDKDLVSGPGPLAYTLPPPNLNPAETRRKDKRGSVFRSNSKRSELATKHSEDSPAFYNPPSDWPKPTTTSNAFISSVPRFAGKSASSIPGPGQYDLTPAQTGGVSIPKSRRLDPQLLDDGPGPGSYSTSASMVRKTFNISIGGLQ